MFIDDIYYIIKYDIICIIYIFGGWWWLVIDIEFKLRFYGLKYFGELDIYCNSIM